MATCSLDQWALDFAGNLRRTERSIALAKARGATLRVGPELELCGYGCEDHLLELDTYDHAWEALAELLRGEASAGCLLDVGMPVMHAGVRYNCRVFVLNRRILLVRPKKHLADDGNYREGRFFTAWGRPGEVEELALPAVVREVAGQARCPIGDALVETNDTVIASETCEELFTPASPHIAAGLNGAEIFTNGSGSHHRLRKLDQRVDLVRNASAKSGGVYLYANQRGCDGGRLYFDGSALVAVNGAFVAQGPQFALGEVDVVTAVVDLAEVRAFRCRFSSRSAQAAEAVRLPRVRVDFDVCAHPVAARLAPSAPLAIHYSDPMEEIARGPAAWLWDYLRRSGARGFFLPLSGGADSAATLAICGSMCQEVHRAVQLEVPGVLEDLRRVLEQPATWEPESAQELAGQLLHTCYMGSKQSSPATKARAAALAGEVGAHHLALSIDGVVTSLISLFSAATGRCPRFEAQGGSRAEDLALQNLQARSRMVVGYLLAQVRRVPALRPPTDRASDGPTPPPKPEHNETDAAAAVGAVGQRGGAAGAGQLQRRRGPARVPHQVRLLQRGPEPHRLHQQGGPAGVPQVGGEEPRVPDPRRGPPRAALRRAPPPRPGRPPAGGRERDGHDLRRARHLRPPPQARGVRPGLHVPQGESVLGRRAWW